jgi:hypothetical protein
LGGGDDDLIYATNSDGAAAGANTGFDTISNFTAAADELVLTGDFNAAGSLNIDDITGDGTLVFGTDAAVNFTTTEEALLRTGLANADLVEAGFATLIANLNALGITSTTGDDALILAQGATQTGVFIYTEAAGDDDISAAELALLGIVDAQISDTDTVLI